ncbi:MAG: hypothetical protein K2H81_07085 [Alistipes sp.]|nr:hypothetical protein [Alistipes sp.]
MKKSIAISLLLLALAFSGIARGQSRGYSDYDRSGRGGSAVKGGVY